MKLIWSRRALEDRRAIYSYIEADDPRAAVIVDEHIASAVQRLKKFPRSGRSGRVENTRELVIARTPYIAPYRITEDTVRILRVILGARIWPDEIAGDG